MAWVYVDYNGLSGVYYIGFGWCRMNECIKMDPRSDRIGMNTKQRAQL